MHNTYIVQTMLRVLKQIFFKICFSTLNIVWAMYVLCIYTDTIYLIPKILVNADVTWSKYWFTHSFINFFNYVFKKWLIIYVLIHSFVHYIFKRKIKTYLLKTCNELYLFFVQWSMNICIYIYIYIYIFIKYIYIYKHIYIYIRWIWI